MVTNFRKCISNWIVDTGGHMSRLAWFEAWFPQSKFYTKLAKPLLSLRTTGSMSVERVAKHLKVAVYTKHRNRLECGNKKMLLRTGLNLRFLLGMKVAMKTTRNKFN